MKIPHGGVDVIVCEAFVGNVILKLYEGVGATMMTMVKKGLMSNLRSKIGALLIKPALKSTLKSFDASQYGGAPLLGLKGTRRENPRKFKGEGGQELDHPVYLL